MIKRKENKVRINQIKRRKKVSVILFAGILGMCLMTGCGQDKTTAKAEEMAKAGSTEKLNIVTTIYAPYDFARQIVGDNAELTMLLKPGTETHSYEPTPQDIITIQNCDVFIYVGGENDEWVDDVLASVADDDLEVVKLLDVVDAVEEEAVEGMEAEEEEAEAEEEAEEEVEWDEHVWTSPKNAILISKTLEEKFAARDSANADTYQKNLDSYVGKLEELDAEFTKVVDSAARKVVVFGDRFPLSYFVDAYGLDYYAAFPGCSSDTEASAATIAFLTDKVQEEQIPVVFKIELSNGNIAETIAEATGAKVLTFYSCHNVSKEDFEAGMSYTDFMWKNVDSLKEALN